MASPRPRPRASLRPRRRRLLSALPALAAPTRARTRAHSVASHELRTRPLSGVVPPMPSTGAEAQLARRARPTQEPSMRDGWWAKARARPTSVAAPMARRPRTSRHSPWSHTASRRSEPCIHGAVHPWHTRCEHEQNGSANGPLFVLERVQKLVATTAPADETLRVSRPLQVLLRSPSWRKPAHLQRCGVSPRPRCLAGERVSVCQS